MNILFLGYKESRIIDFLKSNGETLTTFNDKIDAVFLSEKKTEFIISYGYRFKIRREVIKYLSGKIINLHISLLPFNRGADPNIWSFVDNTPKGVTIHYIDEGIDTGEIILQKEIHFQERETLKTSYDKLHNEIQDLFIQNWEKLKAGLLPSRKQVGKGSYHKTNERERIAHLLTQGYDTPVSSITKFAIN